MFDDTRLIDAASEYNRYIRGTEIVVDPSVASLSSRTPHAWYPWRQKHASDCSSTAFSSNSRARPMTETWWFLSDRSN